MTRAEAIINSFKFAEVYEKVNKLDKNSPTYKKDGAKIVDDYAISIVKTIQEEPLEIRVAVLDRLFNTTPSFAQVVLSKADERLLRAQLVLVKLQGLKPSDIKEDFDQVEAFSSLSITMNNGGGLTNRVQSIANCNKNILLTLKEYLKDKSPEDIDDMVYKDTVKFARGLDKVDSVMFGMANGGYYPKRDSIVENIFNLEQVETINHAYSEVFSKNPFLKAFDYEDVIMNHPEYLTSVKGLYTKCNGNLFDLFIDECNEEDYDDLSDFFEEIVDLNKDDEKGLRWFFREINKRSYNSNKGLYEYLKDKKYFKEYTSYDITDIYNNAVDKLLNGDKDIDPSIINELGSYEGFRKNFNVFLDKFINSEDREYKERLIVPLIVSLIEEQKEKYGLKFKNVFTTSRINMNTIGSYNHEDKVMYINPMVFNQFKDMDLALSYGFNTVFHEVRHACQFTELDKNDALNYSNLTFAMDKILSGTWFSGYYKDNYEHVGYERDAREKAFVDTMTIFRGYPDMQEKYKEEYTNDYSISDYLRKEKIADTEEYFGIINKFLDHMQISFSVAEKNNDNSYVEEEINQYPVIRTFFNVDIDNHTITCKSEEELQEICDKYEEGSIERREAEYSIKAFKYAQKVGEYAADKLSYYPIEERKYNEDVIREVIENVGKAPRR